MVCVDENKNYYTQSMPLMELSYNTLEPVKSKPTLKKKFWIFEYPCLINLIRPCAKSNCSLQHDLPDVRVVGQRLDAIDVQEVRDIFHNEVKRYSRLLERYFCTFCEYYGRHGHKSDLIDMIFICNDPKQQMQSYLVHILDGFVTLGIDYSAALVQILQFNRKLSKRSMFVFSSLMTDKRNTKPQLFLRDLEKFHKEHKFKFNAVIIERLMNISLEAQHHANWFQFVRGIIKATSESEIREMDEQLLARFCKINPSRPNPALQN